MQRTRSEFQCLPGSAGQPISVRDPLGRTSGTAYFPSGDIQSATHAAGKTTTYQTDADGRVIKVTSPLNEVTTYAYDVLDEVTDMYVDPTGLNLHTKYAYDLIEEIASVTTPNGNLAPYIPRVDLDSARIHTNGVPWYTPESKRGITRNNDIYFRPGAYNPGTPEGLGLLGHELVHVGQYKNGMNWLNYFWSARRGDDNNKYEIAARALEERITIDLVAKGPGCCCK